MSWIIYMHTNTINGKLYIGQSKYTWLRINDRWQNGRGYGENTRIGKAIKKYGWDNFKHELIEDNIGTQELANEREIYWIRYYNTYSEGYNCTIGGKNIPLELNYKVKIYCLEINKSFDSIMDASHELNISYNFIARQLYTHHYYEKDQYRFCLDSEKNEFNPENYSIQYDFSNIKRNIICVETEEIFDSIIECSKITGISTQNLSQNCCKNHKTAKGRHYAYLEEFDYNWTPAEEYDSNKRKKVSSLKKSVYCLQTNKFYDSVTDCANELNIPVRSVSRCAKKDGDLIQTHGYNFCYREDYYEGWKPRKKKATIPVFTAESIKKMRNNNRCKPVLCVETNVVYHSASEAERITGISRDTIIRVCNKKNHCKTAGTFHWEWVQF